MNPNHIIGELKMIGKTLITYATKTGINAQVANIIAEVLKTDYATTDITIIDLKNESPDVTSYKNIIVGGGVDNSKVYDEAVDFLGKNFEGKNVALYFSCEGWENPRVENTENNTEKVLSKNSTLKPIAVGAFGGCVIKNGEPVIDEQNKERVRDWSVKLGKMFAECETIPTAETAPEVDEQPVLEESGGIFEIHYDANSKFRFHLKAANGEIIAQSQAYKSKQGAKTGIESIMKNAHTAKIVDLTEEEQEQAQT
jgi:uncharacterized protein YegP (UPF0339 family)/menaquinone-dependent protoporphyrinogen IX oxidase